MVVQWGVAKKQLEVTLLLLGVVAQGNGHGRLMEPPNRSSLWRLKEFEAEQPEKNYDDNQLWCGGMGSQYTLSGGKCGPCGDEYLKARPRENENGGKYGRGVITRTYSPGQTIPIGVELTVNHLGYFIFSLCPIQGPPSGPLTLEEEECFDKYPLPLADGSGTKFLVRSNDTGYYKTSVMLPKDLTCKRCVLRWHYRTGNRWNYVNNETGALGIGDQEIFRGCSDITIGSFPAEPTSSTAAPVMPTVSIMSTLAPVPATNAPPRPTTVHLPTLPPTSSQTPASSQRPETVSTGRPRPIPTQRPPVAILPAAPTIKPNVSEAPSTSSAVSSSSSTVPSTVPSTSSEVPSTPPAAPPSTPDPTTSASSTNQHPHPVMHPPPSPRTKSREPPNISILTTILDSLGNSL